MNAEARHAWREGVAPCLSAHALAALAEALEADDPRLIQGSTTLPPPFPALKDCRCTNACAVGICGLAEGLETVGEVEEFFFRMATEARVRLGAGARYGIGAFAGWFDETPRAEAFPRLLAEVRLALTNRTHEVQAETITPTVELDPFAAEVA